MNTPISWVIVLYLCNSSYLHLCLISVLAVSDYLLSDWMKMCCQVYCVVGEMFIEPLCNILCIDRRKNTTGHSSTWPGVKQFLKEKLKHMDKFIDESKLGLPLEKLGCAAVKEVAICVRRQMDEVDYLREDTMVDQQIIQEMLYSPLTNSGCESRQANLDRRVKFSGGSTPLQTLSNKEVVAGNNYLTSSSFPVKLEDQLKEFKWARHSKEAKEALALQQNLIDLAEDVNKAAFAAKEEKKKKKIARGFLLLEECKLHGGPVTPASIDLLDTLNQKQLLVETRYLRSTTAPAIKERRAVIDSEGKRKMPLLSAESMRENIKAAIKIEAKPVDDIESLIAKAYDETLSK